MTIVDTEQRTIVKLISAAISSTFDDWCSVPGNSLGDTELEDKQTEAVLKVLERLGLDLPALAKLNTQDLMLFPVKHVTHYKGGHYVVLGDGKHTETDEVLTIYRTVDRNVWYTRPARMFAGFVDKVDCRRFVARQMKKLVDLWPDSTDVV